MVPQSMSCHARDRLPKGRAGLLGGAAALNHARLWVSLLPVQGTLEKSPTSQKPPWPPSDNSTRLGKPQCGHMG